MSGGAPNQGLSRVLYIRATPELVEAIERRWESDKDEQPGVALSRADVVRQLLWSALQNTGEGKL